MIFLIGDCTASATEVGRLVREGDIIFHTSRSSQSAAIQRATKSPYSHVGIIFRQGGKPFVFEAASTVEFTPLAEWIARGVDGRYVVKRLADAPAGLTPAAVAKLEKEAERFRGRPYDLAFQWSDDRMYCSELVWKIYQRALKVELGALQHLREFDLGDPLVAAKVRERYGDHVPLGEKVISPAAIFESAKLMIVR